MKYPNFFSGDHKLRYTIAMSKYVIFGNYGNETIALIQWASEQPFDDVTVVSIDTGWSAKGWESRVEQGETLAKSKGFAVERLYPKLDFAGLIQEQGNFPSTRYQWCANFLKALPYIDWLDTFDPRCEATLIHGNRRALALTAGRLPEFIEESEHFGERKVWYPLYKHSDEDLLQLINETGLEFLPHRSLECDPCVNNNKNDFLRLGQQDKTKTKNLEKNINKHMFANKLSGDSEGIEEVVSWVEKNSQSDKLAPVDMGCGSPFCCGL